MSGLTSVAVPTVSTKTTLDSLPSETAGSEQGLVPTTSKTWIAGAVAGPMALVVLVAALFFIRRHLRARNPNPDDVGDRGGREPGLGSHDEATTGWTNRFTMMEKAELPGRDRKSVV